MSAATAAVHRRTAFSRGALLFCCVACVAMGCTENAAGSTEDDGQANGESSGTGTGFVRNQRIIYTDGLHNENTELAARNDRLLLAFRGGESGQIGSGRAHIDVFASTDGGRAFQKGSEIGTDTLPLERDIRDPKIVALKDRLFLYATSRLPGGHYRDLGGEAWVVRSESTDDGATWTSPEKTFADVDDTGTESFWAFWRFTIRKIVGSDGASEQTLYATGYDDGDTTVGLFSSDDGVNWQKRATILHSEDDVPSEAELKFFGDRGEIAVAVIRLDNRGIVEGGQSAICTSKEPFDDWECGRRIDERLDGPTWFLQAHGAEQRSFFFARKHLPCTRKRTAIYELRGEIAVADAPLQVCEIQEVASAGDTAYTALAPLSGDRYLLSWYSTSVDEDPPWLAATYDPSDIWLADVDFAKAPAACTPPTPQAPCEPPALPDATGPIVMTGRYLLAVAPVIFPSELVLFDATVTVNGTSMDLEMQPLNQETREPVGEPWRASGTSLAEDGTFSAKFDAEALPEEAFPRLADPLLTLHDFTLTGKSLSANRLCGSVSGYSQVFGTRVSDRIRLEGSTFGAIRSDDGSHPAPVSSCEAGP